MIVPKNHLFRKIQRRLQFDFIDEKTEDLCAQTVQPSIDPVLLIKMLFIGYLYGINSERPPKEFAVPHGMISCLYSFPVAFLLTRSCPALPFVDMFKLSSTDINENVTIMLSKSSLLFPGTKILRSPFWPCNISNYSSRTTWNISRSSIGRHSYGKE